MRILGINGILTRGHGSTDLLLGALMAFGHEAVDVDIPVRGPFTPRFDAINRADARRVLKLHRPGDAVVAHSRGGLVTWWALREGAMFSSIFLFAPAMESHWTWPRHVNAIHVIHNPDDPALCAGMTLIKHPFGDLGRSGYDGPPDERVTNTCVPYPGHSDYFLPGHILYWARFVHERIDARERAVA